MSALTTILCAVAVLTNETADLQEQIDRVSAVGGGVVRVARGDHLVASIRLKSGVTLQLDEGARLLASTNAADYTVLSDDNRGAVVWSDSARDIALVGKGTVDGRGGDVPRVCGTPNRWRGVTFYRSKGVRIEGVSICNAHTWGCYLRECEDVRIRSVRIENHVNYNNDGLDIEASDVLVEDCEIDSEDDALVFKTRSPRSRVENVVVRHCRFFSNSSAIKIGTESWGRFGNICVTDCVVGVSRPISVRDDYSGVPGVTNRMTGLAAIDLSVVDGGSLDGFRATDIRIGAGFLVPFFLRYGRRNVSECESIYRNVRIERVRMTGCAASRLSSAVTGVAAFNWTDLSSWGDLLAPWNWNRLKPFRPSDVLFRDIEMRLPADDEDDDIRWIVPERAEMYPVAFMFGPDLLPSAAFYVRHADGVRFEDVRIRRVVGCRRRPFLVAEDADVRGFPVEVKGDGE